MLRMFINALSASLSRFSERWVPDPMVIATLLTLCTLAMALIFGNESVRGAPIETLKLWSGGLWKLLPFAMQMCLVLITGHALASTPLVKRLIDQISTLAQSSRSAVTLTALTAMSAGLINWGLGLIVGAFMAREVGVRCAQRGIRLHYPLLGASGYTGLLVWHGGLSGTAPLKVTQLKDLQDISSLDTVIPLSETLFSSTNITLIIGIFIFAPLLLNLMNPKTVLGADRWIKLDAQEDSLTNKDEFKEESLDQSQNSMSPSAKLESGRLLSLCLGVMIIISSGLCLHELGLSQMNLDLINLFALGLGLSLHPSLASYTKTAREAALSCSGIILQFPLYSGIMAVMSGSGITALLSAMVASVASAESLSILTFLMAGFVNLFVPSGGGQWAVQGPLVLESAVALKASLGEAVIAFAHGDAWTNMLQPFWALPLLAITQLRAREIVGYSAALMIALAPWYLIVFWLF